MVKGVQGATNVTIGTLKFFGSAGLGVLGGAGAPETLGASTVLLPVAAYGIVSSTGQVTSGTAQLYTAFSGDFQGGKDMQQAGDIMSGPITGVTTLVVSNGNAEAAATAGNLESMFTLGAGLPYLEGPADKVAHGIDAALSLMGFEDPECK